MELYGKDSLVSFLLCMNGSYHVCFHANHPKYVKRIPSHGMQSSIRITVLQFGYCTSNFDKWQKRKYASLGFGSTYSPRAWHFFVTARTTVLRCVFVWQACTRLKKYPVLPLLVRGPRRISTVKWPPPRRGSTGYFFNSCTCACTNVPKTPSKYL